MVPKSQSCQETRINIFQVTLFGQSSGGTSIFAHFASPLARGLFSKAWMLSASPILNKTYSDAARDNLVFLNNTGCTNINCLYSLTAETITKAVPWDVYPYWAMADQTDLPTLNHFNGAIAIVDGKAFLNPRMVCKRQTI